MNPSMDAYNEDLGKCTRGPYKGLTGCRLPYILKWSSIYGGLEGLGGEHGGPHSTYMTVGLFIFFEGLV